MTRSKGDLQGPLIDTAQQFLGIQRDIPANLADGAERRRPFSADSYLQSASIAGFQRQVSAGRHLVTVTTAHQLGKQGLVIAGADRNIAVRRRTHDNSNAARR